jgi:hypothetical protein
MGRGPQFFALVLFGSKQALPASSRKEGVRECKGSEPLTRQYEQKGEGVSLTPSSYITNRSNWIREDTVPA